MYRFLLAVFLATAAFMHAQAKPATTNMQVNRNANLAQRAVQVDPVMVLQRQVAQLQAQVKELRRQLDLVAKDANAARSNIPKCSADLRESSSPGGTRACQPYQCDPVAGSCLMSCATSEDCTPGTNCDMGIGRGTTGR
jgi:hypothetical protein